MRTVATLLKQKNYHTYVTGKWHLGHSESNLPSKRGFDRTYILDASGADNYEHRPYLPTQGAKPPWYKDGKLIDLPKDFYSSRNLVDEMIQFMKETPKDDDPFFAFLSFQAVHIPVQVPKKYTEKYIETYAKGWGAIKEQRYKKAKELGIIPPDAPLGDMLPILKKWDNLSEEDKKYKAKAMAVNAGMLEAMDFHIGRYLQYLEANDQLDNTVVIITSDNGPEASSAGDVPSMQVWLKWVGYHQDYDRLGEKGSFNYIGPEFASAAAGPSAYFKFLCRRRRTTSTLDFFRSRNSFYPIHSRLFDGHRCHTDHPFDSGNQRIWSNNRKAYDRQKLAAIDSRRDGQSLCS